MNDVRQFVLTGLVVTATLMGCLWLESQSTPPETDEALSLQLPPFVNAASAASIDVSNGSSFLEEEAGICSDPQKLDRYDSSSRISPEKGATQCQSDVN